eukprot:scaffold65672_cov46-Phaeocystis_antarctica.AAC.1
MSASSLNSEEEEVLDVSERHSRRRLDSEPRRLSSGNLPSPGVSDEPLTEQEVLEAQTDIAGHVFQTRLADTSPSTGGRRRRATPIKVKGLVANPNPSLTLTLP